MHKRLRLIALILFMLLLAACDPGSAIAFNPTNAVVQDQSGAFEVYFSDPGGPNAESLRNGPDRELADAIKAARYSVDAALYDLDLWSVRNALISAHQNGVLVRVIAEANNLDREEFQDLIDAGIPVLPDLNDNLMHNKFVVIDHYEVWTGSMNLTINGSYRNDNNLLRIQSSKAAEAYLAEFEEMYTERLFGPASPDNQAEYDFEINNSGIEIYFAPEDDIADRIVELVEGADQSVQFMAFSFTSDDIAHAILYAEDKGVEIQGVMDAGQYSSNTGTEYDRFMDAGLDIWLDGNPERMHHKVFIIDGEIVITGSYNFSSSAENRNDENLVIIWDQELAKEYLLEFNRVLQIAQNK